MWKQYRPIVVMMLTFTFYPTFAMQSQKAIAQSNAKSNVVQVYSSICENLSNPLHQPNGPFAAFVFCEDTLGTYIAVSCYDVGRCEKSTYPDGNVRFSGWDLYNRFWQEKDWATDVTSFAWSPDGKSLYVATSPIYGTGALYRLDLEARLSTKLLSGKADPILIINIDPKGQYLQYELGDNKKVLTLPLKHSH